jgi:hypothetical protein
MLIKTVPSSELTTKSLKATHYMRPNNSPILVKVTHLATLTMIKARHKEHYHDKLAELVLDLHTWITSRKHSHDAIRDKEPLTFFGAFMPHTPSWIRHIASSSELEGLLERMIACVGVIETDSMLRLPGGELVIPTARAAKLAARAWGAAGELAQGLHLACLPEKPWMAQVVATTAPKDYDYAFGVTMELATLQREEKPWRVVLLARESALQIGAQTARYSSGNHPVCSLQQLQLMEWFHDFEDAEAAS